MAGLKAGINQTNIIYIKSQVGHSRIAEFNDGPVTEAVDKENRNCNGFSSFGLCVAGPLVEDSHQWRMASETVVEDSISSATRCNSKIHAGLIHEATYKIPRY